MVEITLQEARDIVDACVKHALELGVRQSIVVVDGHGAPLVLNRMDGTGIGRERFAEAKAFTAVFYGRPTREAAKLLETSPALFHSSMSVFGARLFLWAGGIPIKSDGVVVGGIGVSGATGDQDEAVALAGLSRFSR